MTDKKKDRERKRGRIKTLKKEKIKIGKKTLKRKRSTEILK